MKYAVTASLFAGLANAFYTEDTTFSVVSTGNNLDITEAYEDSSKTYSKVLVHLHGGGGSRQEGIGFLEAGYFGESIAGIKVLCPSSPFDGGIWYDTYKEGENDPCDYGLFDECVYDMDMMDIAGKDIAALIQNEIDVNGIAESDIYLAGYSQGGRMVFNVAHAQLTYAIGGYFGYNTSPLYPVWQTVPESDYSYANADQSWFLFGGKDDLIYPSQDSIAEAEATFAALSSPPTVEYSISAEGVGHALDCRFTEVMMRYIEDGTVTSIDDYEVCAEDKSDYNQDDKNQFEDNGKDNEDKSKKKEKDEDKFQDDQKSKDKSQYGKKKGDKSQVEIENKIKAQDEEENEDNSGSESQEALFYQFQVETENEIKPQDEEENKENSGSESKETLFYRGIVVMIIGAFIIF